MMDSDSSRRPHSPASLLKTFAGLVCGIGALTLISAAAPAWASEPPPSRQPPAEQRDGRREGREGRMVLREAPPTDPAQMKAFVERQIEQLERRKARLQRASEALARGEDPLKVREEMLREGLEELGRGGAPGGQGGGGAGRDGPGRDGPARDGPARDGPARDGQGGIMGERSPVEFSVPSLVGGPRLSPEERQRVRDFLRDYMPEALAKIEELARARPDAADRLIDGLGNRARALMPLRERDPEEFKLRVDELTGVLELMRAARTTVELTKNKALESDITQAKAALRTSMGAQFDLRKTLATRTLTRLRERLDRWQGDLDTMNRRRDELIDQRVAEMLRAMERGLSPREGGPREAGREAGREGDREGGPDRPGQRGPRQGPPEGRRPSVPSPGPGPAPVPGPVPVPGEPDGGDGLPPPR